MEALGVRNATFLQDLEKLDPSQFTNGVLIDIGKHVRSANVPWKAVSLSLGKVFPDRADDSGACHGLAEKFSVVKNKRDRLSKRKEDHGKRRGYLEELFTPPLPRVHPPPQATSVPPKKGSMDFLPEQVIARTSQRLISDLARAERRIEEQNEEISQLKKANTKLMEEKQFLIGKLKAHNTSVCNQRLKRKNESLSRLHRDYKRLKIAYYASSHQEPELSKKLRKQKQKNENIKKQKKHLEQELKKKHIHSEAFKMQKQKLNSMSHELGYFEDQLVQRDEQLNQEIPTQMDGKTYRPEVREASYILQDAGVSQAKASDTLKKLTKAVTGQELVGPLPSYKLQNTFNKEMKSLARQQVREAVKLSGNNNTLKYDGTTKKVGHLVEVEVATPTQTLLMGVRQQIGGTGAAYAETILKACATIESGNENLTVMGTVANTMTDRCATNNVTNRLLEETKGADLNNLKCAMHPLDSIAKEAEKVVRTYEKDNEVDTMANRKNSLPFQHRSESLTQATVRTAAKLFHDTAFNCNDELVSYLKDQGKVPQEKADCNVVYYRFVGNRFHIYFLCAGLLFTYTPSILEFFSTIQAPKNAVQVAVRNALQLQKLQVSMCALGIIGKVVTGPWMRLVGGNHTILELNPYFEEARQNLRTWTEDASPFLHHPPPSLFHSVPIKDDRVLEALQAGLLQHAEALELLQKLFAGVIMVIERQLSDQLPGGTFWNPSDDLVNQTRSCSTTNISGERVFARADMEIVRARHGTASYLESKVMFKTNATGEWLSTLDRDKKHTAIKAAIAEARQIREEDKAAKLELVQGLKNRLEASRTALQQKDDQLRVRNEAILEKVFEGGGLWQHQEDMTKRVAGHGKVKTRSLLTAQINVRVKMLKQDAGLKVALTKASVDELKSHLVILMAMDVCEELQEILELIQEPTTLVGQRFVQQWMENGIRQWFDGKVESFNDNTEEFQMVYATEEAPSFMTVPEVLADILSGDLEIHL